MIILVTKYACSLYLVVQAPEVVKSSISPTGMVDPSTTQWSMEFDRQVSFVLQLTVTV